MKNLIIRTLTGIIFLAVMIGGILYSPATFSLLFTVITALSVWEFTGIVNQRADVSVNRFITTVAGGCLFVTGIISEYRDTNVDKLLLYLRTVQDHGGFNGKTAVTVK